ncbi:amino acid ABC transporter permease [Leptolyngbya sp. FACHB-541]|uniref:amino acid ABC transporter permease n=1 Tax=Leptolyngbya sp. FACHB-541 TaxID=2692810 RepID=UPI001685C6A5|nr:amino acid ABC transporter permease [Leptolyngbya sp. FACHB-541]MBD1997626.1 amino acid ABC transporter permease [Leptolyngbya sp. FACHB-541]
MTTTNPEPSVISAPPITQISPAAWVKKNLFSDWFNTVLTIVCLGAIAWLGYGLLTWIFTQAQWQVVPANLRLFFVGRYPAPLMWRPWTALGIIAISAGLTWGILARSTWLFNRTGLISLGVLAVIFVALSVPVSLNTSLLLLAILGLSVAAAFAGQQIGRRLPTLVSWLALGWLGIFFIVFGLIHGGLFLREVRLDDLSGLLLTLLTAIVSIVLSFPIGILLALGRQSNLPVVRWMSIGFIEIIRGLPLITILFMASLLIPLILPPNVRIDRVVRAIAGLTLFSAAYLAENVRGGLQSIPRGQAEAAKALGLSAPLVTILIILPQALKAVIPTIVGQFISLFKDTSLLAIIGFPELLGISQSILSNPNFLGRYQEVYAFDTVIYFCCCYAMALASRRLEKQLRTENR